MSAFLTFAGLAATIPSGRVLFSHLDLSVGAERIGLVGRNGSGKSTLLRIAAGDAAPSAGTVARAGRIGMLRQAVDADPGSSLADELGAAVALDVLARIVAGNGSELDLEVADWTLETRLNAALAEAGLGGIDLARPIASLSGGQRTRIAIARLLLDAPDLMLLDEPTNNLDADGRAAIGGLLERWGGGAIVASHDRALLERMNRIVELSATGVRVHGGPWSSFVAVRDAEREAVAADYDRAVRDSRRAGREAQQARERKARRDGVGRVYAASGSIARILAGALKERAENSTGRAERLAERRQEAMAEARAAARSRIEVVAPLRLDIPASGLATNRTLLSLTDIAWGPGEHLLLGPLSLDITGPERVAIRGPNGSGKTSLLSIAAGTLAPRFGKVSRADGRIAMLDQQVALLDRGATLLANMRRLHPRLDENAAYAALARFAFRNADALKPVAGLSGGETMRAGLACILSGATVPQLLLLDEPTNHLDLDSIELLEAALRAYDGALLVVSHDSAFLAAIGVEREFMLG